MTNTSRPDPAMLAAHTSLWRRAPAWRRTVVMATLATVAAAALLAEREAFAPQPPTATFAGGMPVSTPTPTPTAAPVHTAALAAQPAGEPMRTRDAPPVAPAPQPAERVVAKTPRPHVLPQPAVALVAVAPRAPASLEVRQPPQADAACPNLARLIPLVEPRYNQSQVVAVRSAEVSANTSRRSLSETGGMIDAKYQYQIDAVLASSTPQFRDGREVHLAAVIPPDLHVQLGDVVAWDGAYRDAPGTCHYVPARVRAVLRHGELPVPLGAPAAPKANDAAVAAPVFVQ